MHESLSDWWLEMSHSALRINQYNRKAVVLIQTNQSWLKITIEFYSMIHSSIHSSIHKWFWHTFSGMNSEGAKPQVHKPRPAGHLCPAGSHKAARAVSSIFYTKYFLLNTNKFCQEFDHNSSFSCPFVAVRLPIF